MVSVGGPLRRTRRRLSGLPLRVRLVAGFSATMLLVLTAAAAFVYWRVEFALDRGLDTELAQASSTLAPLVTPSGRVRDASRADATGAAWQVVEPDGRVVGAGGPAGRRPLVGSTQLTAVGGTSITTEVGGFLPGGTTPYRVRVSKVPDSDLYLVVGVRRDHRDEALRELLLQLALAVLAALAITAVVGDRLARAALAPVERYRARAATIAGGATGLRLDVPVGRDDEVTRLGNTLNEMLAELERLVERERRFVDEASHELRTPLTLLRSRIQMTRRRPRSVAEHERVLDELSTDVTRLTDLAEQLLKLGGVGAVTAGETSDVVAVVAAAVAARGGADAGSVDDVVLEPPADPVPAAAISSAALERILGNLVDNALTHGRPPVRIRVSGVEPAAGRWVRLCVVDDGEGMPPELLRTASGRFTRAAEARSRPGAGLGLSLVDGLVAAAGGELRLCHAGHHEHAGGVTTDVDCEHGPGMSATVLVPSVCDT